MTTRHAAPPGWRLERRGLEDAVLCLTGDWIARETGVRDAAAVRQVLAAAGGAMRLRFETGGSCGGTGYGLPPWASLLIPGRTIFVLWAPPGTWSGRPTRGRTS